MFEFDDKIKVIPTEYTECIWHRKGANGGIL
jgi:hypothetical protein